MINSDEEKRLKNKGIFPNKIQEVEKMALSNIAEWNEEKAASACGSACGAAEKPAACGASTPEEKPAACGSACGAREK